MVLSVKNLSFSYRCFPVLRDVTFQAGSGSLVCVLGKNGAGKSTLFRCILGFLKKYGGSVDVDGKKLSKMTERELASTIAYIPQKTGSTFSFSVIDMVLMGTTPSLSGFTSPGKAERARAMEMLKAMKVGHLAGRSFAHCSGGEQQLVLIARSMAQQAKILVMDEPCSNLDYGNQARVMEELKRLAGEGYLILQSTHSPDQAFLYGDQALVLAEGKIAAYGPPDQALTEELLESIYEIPIDLFPVNQGRMLCMPGRIPS